MKVIDLLVKIEKDKLPDKTRVVFKEHNTECIYHKDGKKFEFVEKGDWNDYFYGVDFKELSEEVEIIEEKNIEEIKMIGCNVEVTIGNNKTMLPTESMINDIIINKVNELVREVNKLRKEVK